MAHSPVPARSNTRAWLKAAQWIFVGLIVLFLCRAVAGQWSKVKDSIDGIHFNSISWAPICVASLLMLAMYAILIETWRRMLAAWNEGMPWRAAARIWFASSLGKYVPGYIWSLTAMGVMAREQGTSAVAAAGSSIIVNAVSIATGIALALASVSQQFHEWWAVVLVADVLGLGVLITVLSVPSALATAVAWLNRVTHRRIEMPHLAPGAIVFTLATTVVAWIGYGVALELFAAGILHRDVATMLTFSNSMLYIGLYAGAYILGLISPIPAGLGAREGALISGLSGLSVLTFGEATIVVLLGRIWITALEALPGLISLFLFKQSNTHPSTAP